MAAKTPITRIFMDLVSAFSATIETKYIFLGRPNTADEGKMSKFLVVELPTKMEDYVVGRKKWRLDTMGIVYLFVKNKKDNTLNINAVSDFTSTVEDLFPIVGKVCEATNPVVIMSGTDDYGYHIVTITFDLRTKVNVFEQ